MPVTVRLQELSELRAKLPCELKELPPPPEVRATQQQLKQLLLLGARVACFSLLLLYVLCYFYFRLIGSMYDWSGPQGGWPGFSAVFHWPITVPSVELGNVSLARTLLTWSTRPYLWFGVPWAAGRLLALGIMGSATKLNFRDSKGLGRVALLASCAALVLIALLARVSAGTLAQNTGKSVYAAFLFGLALQTPVFLGTAFIALKRAFRGSSVCSSCGLFQEIVLPWRKLKIRHFIPVLLDVLPAEYHNHVSALKDCHSPGTLFLVKVYRCPTCVNADIRLEVQAMQKENRKHLKAGAMKAAGRSLDKSIPWLDLRVVAEERERVLAALAAAPELSLKEDAWGDFD
jgi:hypothetical protein